MGRSQGVLSLQLGEKPWHTGPGPDRIPSTSGPLVDVGEAIVLVAAINERP